MDIPLKEKDPTDLEYLTFGGLSVVGVILLSTLVMGSIWGTRAYRNTKNAQKVLSQVPALRATGLKMYSEDPRGVYVLLDKDGDNQADFEAKPKEPIDFKEMNGQPGTKWMNKLSLTTFHELNKQKGQR